MMSYQDKKSDVVVFVKKTTFFITAFIPLWTILIINYSMTNNPNWYVVIASTIFLSVIIITLTQYLKKKKNTTTEQLYFKVVKKSEITHDVVFYILAYIPILLINKFELPEFPTFIILLFTIYVLYVKTNMLHINPIISLLYHTYKATDDHDNTVVFFSKLALKTGNDVAYQEITHNLNMVVK